MRVAQFLKDQHAVFETILHAPAFTAQKRAKYIGVTGRHVAKSVLLAGPEGYVLAVLPATKHVDTARLADALGGPVRVADDREIAEVFRDCEYGVVAAFGTLYGLPTFLDESLDPEVPVVFEADTHAIAVRMLCRDFEQLEHPRRLQFSRR